MNYARFYALLGRLPGRNDDTKAHLVARFTAGRTTSLRQMTPAEYDALCAALERVLRGAGSGAGRGAGRGAGLEAGCGTGHNAGYDAGRDSSRGAGYDAGRDAGSGVRCEAGREELLRGEGRDAGREELRRRRSAALCQMQRLGIDTTDWVRVNAFCRDRRIAGLPFAALTARQLEALAAKLRTIARRGGLKQYQTPEARTTQPSPNPQPLRTPEPSPTPQPFHSPELSHSPQPSRRPPEPLLVLLPGDDAPVN